MLIRRSDVRTRQPTWPLLEKPNARGLIHAWAIPSNAGGPGVTALPDLVGSAHGVFGTGIPSSTTGNYWKAGKSGQELYFDNAGTGTTDSTRLKIGNSAGSGGPGGNVFSLAFDVLVKDLASAQGLFGSSGSGVAIDVTNTGVIRFLKEAVALIGSWGTAITPQVKTRIGVSYDGTTAKFYVNGKPDGTSISAQSFSTAVQYYLGWNAASGVYLGNGGRLSRLVMSNVVWSDGEFLSDAQNPWGIFPPERRTLFVQSGGVGPDATGTGSLDEVSIAAPTASASATSNAIANTAPSLITLGTVTASATGSALATTSLATISLSGVFSSAIGSALATGLLGASSITAPAALAYGSALATMTVPSVSLSTVYGSASASGVGSASGYIASSALSAIQVNASTSSQASGPIQDIYLSGVYGSASSANGAVATGSIQPIAISAIDAIAIGSSVATGGVQSIGMTSPSATASNGAVVSGLTVEQIAAAVIAALNATTGSRTIGQHLQIQTAVLAGSESGAGTSHISFTDGDAVVEADVPLPGVVGNRTNVIISGV